MINILYCSQCNWSPHLRRGVRPGLCPHGHAAAQLAGGLAHPEAEAEKQQGQRPRVRQGGEAGQTAGGDGAPQCGHHHQPRQHRPQQHQPRGAPLGLCYGLSGWRGAPQEQASAALGGVAQGWVLHPRGRPLACGGYNKHFLCTNGPH